MPEQPNFNRYQFRGVSGFTQYAPESSRQFGLSDLYRNRIGASEFSLFTLARRERDWILGKGAWSSSRKPPSSSAHP